MKTQLAQRLKAARMAISPDITQRDLAKRMGLSPSAVNLWEAGKTEPGVTQIAELSRWYQVSTDWLLGVDDSDSATSTKKTKPAIHTVPVVDPASLVRWAWDAINSTLQTSKSYPPGTAAAILVNTDALASICPPGSFATIAKAQEIKSGAVVLAMAAKNSEPVLRKYVKEGGTELFVADDMRYPSYRLDEGAKIIGRVMEVTIRKILN